MIDDIRDYAQEAANSAQEAAAAAKEAGDFAQDARSCMNRACGY